MAARRRRRVVAAALVATTADGWRGTAPALVCVCAAEAAWPWGGAPSDATSASAQFTAAAAAAQRRPWWRRRLQSTSGDVTGIDEYAAGVPEYLTMKSVWADS